MMKKIRYSVLAALLLVSSLAPAARLSPTRTFAWDHKTPDATYFPDWQTCGYYDLYLCVGANCRAIKIPGGNTRRATVSAPTDLTGDFNATVKACYSCRPAVVCSKQSNMVVWDRTAPEPPEHGFLSR